MSILFYLFLFLIIYSYLIYPRSLRYFRTKTSKDTSSYTVHGIHVIIAAYNEEHNIASTLQSILQSSIGNIGLTIYVGDDGSTDRTLEIFTDFKSQFPEKIRVEQYHRIGKSEVVHRMIEKYHLHQAGNALILMDANIALAPTCISEIVRRLEIEKTGIVGASVYPKSNSDNVESSYILRENIMKSEEARAFGVVIGVFGACYGMRGEVYQKIPSKFITDDLYATLAAIEKGYQIAYHPDIRCYEQISADFANEFTRKKRYAAGNFQILGYFISLLNPLQTSLGFVYAYFFHKIIRWLSPIFMLGFWIYSWIGNDSALFHVIRLSGIWVLLYMAANYALYSMKKPLILPRLNYFLGMNLAIVFGFVHYLKGIKTNVWERSERQIS